MARKKDITPNKARQELRALIGADQVGFSEYAEIWHDDPVKFFHKLGLLTPEKIEAIIRDCTNPDVPKILIIGPRGGGKTLDVSIVTGGLFAFEEYDVIQLGGSLDQSKKGYEYLENYFFMNPDVASDEIDTALKTMAKGKRGNWLKIAPCSKKAVRGPHAGDPHHEMGNVRHGGLLVIDEEAEADETVVKAAFKTNNTAKPRKTIRLSTDHEPDSSFAKQVDSPGGYVVHKFDAFDICEKCCRSCKKCLVEFAGRKHHAYAEWCAELGIPDRGPDAPHGYCEGRAKTHKSGHLEIQELIDDFLENGTEDFETEYLNIRPRQAGKIIPLNILDACLTGENKMIQPMRGTPTGFYSDWGVRFTAMVVLQQQLDRNVAVIDAEHLIGQHTDQLIIDTGKRMIRLHDAQFGAGDSNNQWMNDRMSREANINIRDFFFSKEKETGVGALKFLAEQGYLKIPGKKVGSNYYFPKPAFKILFKQMRNWKRDKNGKIVKKDDHYPDSLLQGAPDFRAGTFQDTAIVSKKQNQSDVRGLIGRTRQFPGVLNTPPGGFFD